jgi:hypothetical protein
MVIKNSVMLLFVGCFFPHIFCMNSDQSKMNAITQKSLYSNIPRELWDNIQGYHSRIIFEKTLSEAETKKHNEPFKYYYRPFTTAPNIKCSIKINDNQPTPRFSQWLYQDQPHDYGQANLGYGKNEKEDNNQDIFCFGPFHRDTKRAYIISNTIGIADNSKRKTDFFAIPSFFLAPCGQNLPWDYISRYLSGQLVACDNNNKCLYTAKPNTGFLICHQYEPEKSSFKQKIIQENLQPEIILQLLPEKLREFYRLQEGEYRRFDYYKMQIDLRYPSMFLISYKNERKNTEYKLYSRESDSVVHAGECLPHETVLLDQGMPEGLRILGDHTSLRVVTIGEKFDFMSVYLVGLMHQAQSLARYIRSNQHIQSHAIALNTFDAAGAILTDFKNSIPNSADRYFWIYQSKNDDGSYGVKILHDYFKKTCGRNILAMVIVSEALRIQRPK